MTYGYAPQTGNGHHNAPITYLDANGVIHTVYTHDSKDA